MDYQFYPTPPDLAERAWAKFKDRKFERVLEPSAGNGDLAKAGLKLGYHRTIKIDVCEIDATRHAVLRDLGLTVVGLDFMEFGSGAMYSNVILNPPFKDGAKHVLKAWDMIWDGEIVAIINAETLRNPFSGERELLASLVERFGSVEYLSSEFMTEDTQRKTAVEVALVYLRKEANVTVDIIGNLIGDLKKDQDESAKISSQFKEDMMPSIPNSSIENLVLTFNAAVTSLRDAVFSSAKASYYASLIGESITRQDSGEVGVKPSHTVQQVRESFSRGYNDLKERAWSNVLRSTDVKSRLSHDAQKRLESEFESIKKLEFTVQNIYGFLCGLIEKQGQIQIEMLCDVFDKFTRYHSDNAVYYKGWKSNDRHRECGMRLRATRVVIPGYKPNSWSTSLNYEGMQMLSDFDKVFAMLDGKTEPEVSLATVFNQEYNNLIRGARAASSYFDVRYHPGVGTIHFFPTNKKLVDRLNRIVGRHREWLPPEQAKVSNAFWLQYDSAEKFDKEFRSELAKSTRNTYDSPLNAVVYRRGRDGQQTSNAYRLIDNALNAVLEKHGISTEYQIEHQSEKQGGNQKEILLLQAA